MAIIKKGEYLWGTRWWALWRAFSVPKFEIYLFVGQDPRRNTYCFKSKITGRYVEYTFDQLQRETTYRRFMPFLLDFKKIRDHFDADL